MTNIKIPLGCFAATLALLATVAPFCAPESALAEWKPTPPEALVVQPYLYHAGYRPEIETDIRAHGIPKKVWDKYIMAGDGNFSGLPQYRKGLYGVEPGQLSAVSQYGYGEWEKGRENWVMLIHLKEECRQSRHVAQEFSGMYRPKPNNFANWLIDELPKMDPEAIKLCYSTTSRDQGNGNTAVIENWDSGPYFDLSKMDAESRHISQVCGGAIERFFEHDDIRIFDDPASGMSVTSPNSYGVRDRSCIENITGTPDDLFQEFFLSALANDDEIFPDDFIGDSVVPDIRPAVGFQMAVTIFSEAKGFLTADWSKLAPRINSAYIAGDYKEPKGFQVTHGQMRESEYEDLYKHLIDASQTCASRQRLPQLQQLLHSYADWIFSRKKTCAQHIAADPLCRWGKTQYKINDETKATVPDISKMSFDTAPDLILAAEKLCGK
jgi:hypothetical protein